MIRKNQRIINLLNLASDAGLIFIAYFAALIVRFEWMKNAYISVPLYSLRYACVAGAYSVLMVLIYCVFRMYGSYRFKDQSSEIITILLLNGISATKGEGIRALLNSSLSPMKIENEGFTALVLPVRMKNRA